MSRTHGVGQPHALASCQHPLFSRMHWSTAYRQQAEQQQGELRAWLDDLRLERQRLEERVLAGGACAAQETRADLEAAIQRLSRDKAALHSEVASLQAEQQQQNDHLVRLPSCVTKHSCRCVMERAREGSSQSHPSELTGLQGLREKESFVRSFKRCTPE